MRPSRCILGFGILTALSSLTLAAPAEYSTPATLFTVTVPQTDLPTPSSVTLPARNVSDDTSKTIHTQTTSTPDKHRPRTREEIIKEAAQSFAMTPKNVAASDYITPFRAWEDEELNKTEAASLASRYAAQMWGETEWFCDPDNGCPNKPSPAVILEYIEVHFPELTRDERLVKAQQVYFTGMNFWAMSRLLSNVNRAMDRTKSSLIARVDSIILDFTRQEESKSIIQCKIRMYLFELMWQVVTVAIDLGLKQLAPVDSKTFVDSNKFAEGVELVDVITFTDKWQFGNAIPSGKLGPNFYLGHLKSHTQTLATEWAKYSPSMRYGPTQKNADFLKLNIPYTAGGFCGDLDGTAGTGGDNLWRMAEMRSHVVEIFDAYAQIVTSFHQCLNGQADCERMRISSWMSNTDWEKTVEQLDHADPAAQASSWTQSLSGYLISVAWAANKCYMKCDSDLDPDLVIARCNEEQYKDIRFCPAEEPRTLCQANCWTMLRDYNHERELWGKNALGKYGLDMELVKQNSWKHYQLYKNDFGLLPLTYDNSSAMLNLGDEGVTLTVSYNKANEIADKLESSKDFPCFSGDWTGSDTHAFMDRLSMGINSTDWGSNGKMRAFETLRSICPAKAWKMMPFTRYLNMMCGHRLYWPSTSAHDGLVHRRRLHPDTEGVNDANCTILYERAQGLSERQANWEFCTMMWPEADAIFEHERWWIYAGGGMMESHWRACKSWKKWLGNGEREWFERNSIALKEEGERKKEEEEKRKKEEEEKEKKLPAELENKERVFEPFEKARDGGDKTKNIPALLEELNDIAEEVEKEEKRKMMMM
ncbi:hypothetical protein CJF30_00004988 [Rutstroemia sp. NJR-2017a BBW]|nr:hypothetical protein CJF30_00004988 [Rutstroemia sp. NJR-2017a BBW]